MKIIVITYSYAPKISPRALRWTSLCEHFEKLGHDVHVITGFESGQLREEIIGGVKIYRVGGNLNLVRRWALGKSNFKLNRDAHEDDVSSKFSTVITRLSSNMRKMLRKLHDLTWKKIYWPDAIIMWVWPALRRSCLLIAKLDIDVMITVSHPFSDHLVGFLIRRTHPNLGWLADNGDPFAFSDGLPSNNFALYKKVNYWFEAKVLQSVNYFAVTTEETRRLYLAQFVISDRTIIVIPPLLNPLLEDSNLRDSDLFDNEAIVLLFVGIFYHEVRSPAPLLRLIDALVGRSKLLNQRLQLHVIGPVDIISQELTKYPHIRSRVFLHGSVSHRKALSAMLNANCLVNIGNTTAYQLPSKVIEYMATGLPILNLYTISNDSSITALRNYPRHLNLHVENDIGYENVISFIESSYRKNKDYRCNGFADKYKIDEISKRYISLLGRILKC